VLCDGNLDIDFIAIDIAIIMQQRSTNTNDMDMRSKCGYRIWYKHQYAVHKHSWSWRPCRIPRVSSALRGRWRRPILQHQSKKNHVDTN